jgi:PIN domain nuclease of toxin-antitoxin system
MLVAQALHEGLVLVTVDERLKRYGVATLGVPARTGPTALDA